MTFLSSRRDHPVALDGRHNDLALENSLLRDELSSLEEKYDSLLQLTGEAIIVTDRSGLIREANSIASHLTGVPQEQLVEMPLAGLIYEVDHTKYKDMLELLASAGSSKGALRLHRRDGSVADVSWMANRISGERFHIVLTDITSRNQREMELQQQNRRAVALYEIGRQITSSFDVERVLKMIVENTGWLLECSSACVALYDTVSNTLSWRAAIGCRNPQSLGITFAPGRGLPGRVFTANAPVILRCFPDDPPVDPDEFGFIATEGLKSIFGVPISHKGSVLGVLIGGYRAFHRFTDDEIRLASSLADQTALALENARLYRSSVDHSKVLAALSSRLTVIQEEERRRIARELHDGVGQALTGIRFNLDLLCREVPIPEGAGLERVRSLKSIIDETIEDTRQMAFELRPSVLDDFGLVSALRLYVDRFKARTNIDVQLDLSEPLKRSDPHVEATLYRIIQEALTNVARHSHATVAQIDLHPLPTGISLDIADNGCGFAPEGAGQTRKVLQGLGVINMKERIGGLNGKFELQSAEGRGTRIHIEIPRQ